MWGGRAGDKTWWGVGGVCFYLLVSGCLGFVPSLWVTPCLPHHRCVICMLDFAYGDPVRFLPCLHTYHVGCIDDWLMRSLTCPSCMEPVDAALLSSYET